MVQQPLGTIQEVRLLIEFNYLSEGIFGYQNVGHQRYQLLHAEDLNIFVKVLAGSELETGELIGPIRVPRNKKEKHEEIPNHIPLYIGKFQTIMQNVAIIRTVEPQRINIRAPTMCLFCILSQCWKEKGETCRKLREIIIKCRYRNVGQSQIARVEYCCASGYLMVIFHGKKQGLHNIMAYTTEVNKH